MYYSIVYLFDGFPNFCAADGGNGVSVYLLCLRQFRNIHSEVTLLSVETIGPCLHHINDQVIM